MKLLQINQENTCPMYKSRAYLSKKVEIKQVLLHCPLIEKQSTERNGFRLIGIEEMKRDTKFKLLQLPRQKSEISIKNTVVSTGTQTRDMQHVSIEKPNDLLSAETADAISITETEPSCSLPIQVTEPPCTISIQETETTRNVSIETNETNLIPAPKSTRKKVSIIKKSSKIEKIDPFAESHYQSKMYDFKLQSLRSLLYLQSFLQIE
jgi:hypothetical protein